MKANNGYRKPTGAEIRAQRIAREVQPTPAEEARHRERKLLAGLGGAADDLEWLATNQAWTLLGHDTCAAWWDARVRPVAETLGFEPTRELGMRFVELIRAEEASLPPAQRRSNKELAAFVGVSEWAARGRQDPRQRRSAAYVDHGGPVVDSTFTEDSKLADITAALTQAIEETAAHTSAAGPAANPEGDSPVLGGPVDVGVAAASTGTQSPPAADASTTLPHAGVPAVGDQIEERIEEEAAEPRERIPLPVYCHDCKSIDERCEQHQDSPAAATTSLPDGDGNPMPEQSQQPGQDSPPVLGSEGFPGRAETDHQQVTGVSPAGVAPEVASTDPVEPGELEDGEAAVTPSSSVLATAGNPAERLLLAVAGLVHYLNQVDVDAVGPLLLGPDVEQLFDHADAITAHIERIGKARFAEMLHP